MSDHTDIIDHVNSIFDTVDANDWDGALMLFDPPGDVSVGTHLLSWWPPSRW